MAEKELKMHAMAGTTETVTVSGKGVLSRKKEKTGGNSV